MSNVSATTNSTPPKPGFSTRQLSVIGVMTAVTCVLAPFSLPIGPVPISLTNLAIYFSLYVLGTKYGCISYLVYLLIGFIGVPVFSGFTSGPGKLLGPTGGYLIGFLPMALIAGLCWAWPGPPPSSTPSARSGSPTRLAWTGKLR